MQTLKSVPGSSRPSTISVVRSSLAHSGLRSLYVGLSASLMRQMTYSMVRLGVYERMKTRLAEEGKSTGLLLLLSACVAGGLGGVAGNPAGTFSAHLLSFRALRILRYHFGSDDQWFEQSAGKAIQLPQCFLRPYGFDQRRWIERTYSRSWNKYGKPSCYWFFFSTTLTTTLSVSGHYNECTCLSTVMWLFSSHSK